MQRVILRARVDGLGYRGDVVEVSDGYARNYLIPKGYASRSSPGAELEAASMQRAEEERTARERAAAEEIAAVLARIQIRIPARVGPGGRLFGSITPGEIADAVYEQTGHEIDRRVIEIEEPIKELGMHMVPAHLHADVKLFLQVDVIDEEQQ